MHPIETHRILAGKLHVDVKTLHNVLVSKNPDGSINIKPFSTEIHSTPYLNNAQIKGCTVTDLDNPTITYLLV